MNDSNNILKFELSPHDLKIKSLLKNEFLAIEINAISSVYPNRNKSHFTKESMEKALPSFYDKPILGAFDKIQDDFKGHDDDGIAFDKDYDNPYYEYGSGHSEIPLGTIRQSDKVELVEKDGLSWIVVSAALWTNYGYRQVKKLLRSGKKKISVEVEVNKFHTDDNEIQVIDEFTLMRITILGEQVTEAIPGAHLTIPELLEDAVFQKRAQCLSFAYKELDKAMNKTSDADILTDFAEKQPSVDNEHSDEINMEEIQRGGEKLTYEEKRQLLELALNRSPEGMNEEQCHCFVWVADVDDTNVFYQNGDGYFSAPYTFEANEEGHMEAVIDFDNKVAVVRSWKIYSAEEDSKEDEKEVEACDTKEEESCEKEAATSEEKQEESCEEKQEESVENKEEEACDNKEEEACEAEEEPHEEKETCPECGEDPCVCAKEEEACPECGESPCVCQHAAEEPEEGSDEEEKDDDKDDDKEVESASEENKEEDMSETCDFSAETDNAESVETSDVSDSVSVFTINEKTYTAEELVSEFERVSNELSEMTSKFNAANDKLVEIHNNESYAFACSIIDSEEDLVAENANSIKEAIKTSCFEGKFASNEEVQEAAEHLIADALYAQKKMSKKTDKEFSSSIVKDPISNFNFNSENSDSTDKLKSSIAKLRKI